MRPVPHRPFPLAGLAPALVLLVVVAAVPPARAGFGDLVKKAKDKAATTVVKRAAGGPATGGGNGVEFTDELLELEGERLEKVIAGLEAGDAVLAGRAGLVARRQKLDAEADDIVARQGAALDAARTRRDEIEYCRQEFLSERAAARQEELDRSVLTDPALRERFMELGLRVAEAMAEGDTAEAAKAQGELAALSGPTRADSLAARQKCGPLPPIHPAQAKVDSLRGLVAGIDRQLRANDEKSIAAQVEASGLTARQFAMARERLVLWLEAVRAKREPNGFGAAELAALAERRARLEPLLAAWMR